MVKNSRRGFVKPLVIGLIFGTAVAGTLLLSNFLPRMATNFTGRATGPITSPLSCPPSVANKASDFRTGLSGNYRENLAILLAASRRVNDADPNAADALKALDDNAWDLGYFLENFYGKDVSNEFTSLWQEQNKAFIDYTQAIRDNDSNAKSLAEQEIQNHIQHKTAFWKRLIPHLDTNRYQRLVVSRSDSIKSSITSYAGKEVAKSFKEQHTAYQQTGLVADLLSEAIVEAQPEKFAK